ncbi:hypothetical protein KHA93_13210 [Bacillus sp. FJAT-49732]|uniref:Oligosaccharide repeat unit polymerase n=1 Tax=Lederbergia citrisecunda TaxID=2833583 RepID=A0A942TLR8_9BACI|nr:hypothetical protein [Lederbergia citrisecunda]MBS4200591.1 hypothetical protein [Lederbergia citrisecunda]
MVTQKKIIKAAYMPIIILMSYLFLTILLYHTWVIKWFIPNPVQMTTYVIFNFIILWFGYYVYAREHKHNLPQSFFDGDLQFTRKKNAIIIISAIYNILSVFVYSNYFMGGISLSNILSPGSSYLYRQIEFSGERNIIVQLFTYSWVLSYFYYPMGIIYWKKLNIYMRLLFVISLVMTIIYWLNMGTMKGLGDLVIVFIPIFLLKRYVFSISRASNKSVKKTRTLSLVVLFCLFVMAFSVVGEGRKEEIGLKTTEVFYVSQAMKPFLKEIDSDSIIIKILGLNLSTSLTDLVNYTTQGYTGLAYAFNLPFEWTYGVGHSRTLTEQAEKFTDKSISSKTYLARNEAINSWPNGMFWSSVFPWLASDLSFYGVPFFMFLIGILLAYCWFDFIYKKNILALIALGQLFIFGFFIPANNQLVQSHQSFFGTTALFIIYFLSKIFRKNIWDKSRR